MDWEELVRSGNLARIRELDPTPAVLKKILVSGYVYNKVDIINFAFSSLGGWPKLLADATSKLIVQCFLSIKMFKENENLYHGFMQSLLSHGHYNPVIATEIQSAVLVFLCNMSKTPTCYAFQVFCFYIKCMHLNPSELLLKNNIMYELSLVSAAKLNRVHVLEFLAKDASMILPNIPLTVLFCNTQVSVVV